MRTSRHWKHVRPLIISESILQSHLLRHIKITHVISSVNHSSTSSRKYANNTRRRSAPPNRYKKRQPYNSKPSKEVDFDTEQGSEFNPEEGGYPDSSDNNSEAFDPLNGSNYSRNSGSINRQLLANLPSGQIAETESQEDILRLSMAGKTETEILREAYKKPPQETIEKVNRDDTSSRAVNRVIDIMLMPVRNPILAPKPNPNRCNVTVEQFFRNKPKVMNNWIELGELYGFARREDQVQLMELEIEKEFGIDFKKKNTDLALLLATAYSRCGNSTKVKEYLPFVSKKHQLTNKYYSLLAKPLMYEQKFAEAFALLKEMEENEIIPDKQFYTILLQGCIDNEKFEKGWEVYNYMRRIKGYEPDEIILTKLICACGKTQEAERAFGLFEEYKAMGLQLNEAVFTALIGCIQYRRDFLPKAFLLFEQMKASGIFPDVVAFNKLLRVFAEFGKTRWAEEVFKEVEKLGLVNNRVYTNLALAYVNEAQVSSHVIQFDNTKKVEWIFTKMLKDGWKHDLTSRTVLLSLYAETHKVKKAEIIFKENKELKLVDEQSYNIMMKCYGDTAEIDKAIALWKEMKQVEIPPGPITYEYFIKALARRGYINSMMKYMREMRSKGWIPERKIKDLMLQRVAEWPHLYQEVKVLTQEVVHHKNVNRRNMLAWKLNIRHGIPVNVKLI